MKRIFIAIKTSESLGEKVRDWQKSYTNLPVRWIKPENLHITLIPPWYTDDVGKIKNQLKTVSTSPFLLNFNQITYGPPGNHRLIWAEGQAPKELIDIKQQIEKILDKPQENRPFRLHLTLARFRPEDFRTFPIKKIEDKIDWREKVESVVLMESHLSQSGAEYEILEEIPFTEA